MTEIGHLLLGHRDFTRGPQDENWKKEYKETMDSLKRNTTKIEDKKDPRTRIGRRNTKKPWIV